MTIEQAQSLKVGDRVEWITGDKATVCFRSRQVATIRFDRWQDVEHLTMSGKLSVLLDRCRNNHLPYIFRLDENKS